MTNPDTRFMLTLVEKFAIINNIKNEYKYFRKGGKIKK